MGNWKLVDTGGTERDLESYYYFQVEQVNGGSAPPVEVFGTPYAVLPGEVADGERVGARDVFLTGTIYGTSITTLNQRKTALFDAIKHWRTGQTDRNSDPILLRYTGSQRTVELQCKYVGGYEGGYDWQGGTSERLALHFRAQEDPTWRATSNTTLTLDVQDGGTSRYVIGKVSGVWNLLGPPAAATGGAKDVYSILHNGTALYVAGDFQGFDNDGDLDYFCKYTTAGGWLKVATGGEGTNWVNSIVESPSGLIYLGGLFENWGTDGDRDYVCSYNPTTDAYGDVGTGPSGPAFTLAINQSNGYLYAGVGIAGATVEYWNGAAWTDLVAAFTGGYIRSICFTPDGTLWAGGIIDDGGPDDGILRKYDGSWTTIHQGDAADVVYSVAPLSDGRVVVAGDFDGWGGLATVNNICIYNGQGWDDMDGGIGTGGTDVVYSVFVDADDTVYASGIIGADGFIKKWDGYQWSDLDLNLPAGIAYGMAFNGDDIYLGGTWDGTAYYSGDATSIAGGTYTEVYPTITIKREGYTTFTLKYIENASYDKRMYFDLYILDGETITINCQTKTITSDAGRIITGQPLPGSDFGSFFIRGASNIINVYADIDGAGTITAQAVYRMHYDGYEGGDAT